MLGRKHCEIYKCLHAKLNSNFFTGARLQVLTLACTHALLTACVNKPTLTFMQECCLAHTLEIREVLERTF
jgi:hypothetical protein